MSYNIRQFKSTSLKGQYIQNITGTVIKDETINLDNNFPSQQDGMLYLNKDFSKGTTYYFNVDLALQGAKGTTNVQRIIVKLYSDPNTFQIVRILNARETLKNIVLMFTPKLNFKYLVFEIERNSTTINDENVYYKCDEINNRKILNNILQDEGFGDGQNKVLKKIGIQGPPGLLFAVNGESMKLGDSGIYESHNLEISSLGFVINNNDNKKELDTFIGYNSKFFIVDYLY